LGCGKTALQLGSQFLIVVDADESVLENPGTVYPPILDTHIVADDGLVGVSAPPEGIDLVIAESPDLTQVGVLDEVPILQNNPALAKGEQAAPDTENAQRDEQHATEDSQDPIEVAALCRCRQHYDSQRAEQCRTQYKCEDNLRAAVKP